MRTLLGHCEDVVRTLLGPCTTTNPACSKNTLLLRFLSEALQKLLTNTYIISRIKHLDRKHNLVETEYRSEGRSVCTKNIFILNVLKTLILF